MKKSTATVIMLAIVVGTFGASLAFAKFTPVPQARATHGEGR